MSSVFDRVKDPWIEPTLEPSHEIVAEPIVALLPAALRLPPTVASELVPLPVLSRPLLPGPAADTVAGANAATISIEAAASQPALRTKEPRRARRAERRGFIRWSPKCGDETGPTRGVLPCRTGTAYGAKRTGTRLGLFDRRDHTRLFQSHQRSQLSVRQVNGPAVAGP